VTPKCLPLYSSPNDLDLTTIIWWSLISKANGAVETEASPKLKKKINANYFKISKQSFQAKGAV
jgi:hypothetical protein